MCKFSIQLNRWEHAVSRVPHWTVQRIEANNPKRTVVITTVEIGPQAFDVGFFVYVDSRAGYHSLFGCGRFLVEVVSKFVASRFSLGNDMLWWMKRCCYLVYIVICMAFAFRKIDC